MCSAFKAHVVSAESMTMDMEKRKKSVQFSVDVYDERDTQCGIPLCPVTFFSDLRFLLPLGFFVIFVQGIVSSTAGPQEIGEQVSIAVTSVLLSYFGRNHKPRWLAVGSILTSVSCFILGFQTTMISNFWLLGFMAQFLSSIGLLLSVSLGATYLDNNFPRYFPFILGIGAALKTTGRLILTHPSLWMTLGSLVGIVALPISLLPKVIHRVVSKYGITVNPTDEPSVLKDMRDSLLSVLKNEMIMLNCLSSVFFFLGLHLICNERVGTGVQAIGFLLSGWFIQFVKPRGKVLASANIVVGLGFFIHSCYHAFICSCDFISFAFFSSFLFLSCFGRIGSFLFCLRSTERNENKSVAVGITVALISLFLIPKKLLLDLSCPCDDHQTFEVIYYSSCSSQCCQSNFVPNLIGAGMTLIGVIFDWLVWCRSDSLALYS